MFTNLLSFLGIEEAALVIEVEIRSSLDLCLHFWGCGAIAKLCSFTAKRVIGLKLECELALW